MSLDFNLVGLKVVDQRGKKLGKIVDYTIDSGSFMVYQLIVQRPVMSSFIDPQLTINRSQIVEIDDFKVTIKHSTSKVKVKKAKVARKKQTIKPAKYLTIRNARGKLAYKLTGVNKKKFKKFFKVNAKNGNITVKKGLKKGKYKVTATVFAAGNSKYGQATKKRTFKIVVK